MVSYCCEWFSSHPRNGWWFLHPVYTDLFMTRDTSSASVTKVMLTAWMRCFPNAKHSAPRPLCDTNCIIRELKSRQVKEWLPLLAQKYEFHLYGMYPCCCIDITVALLIKIVNTCTCHVFTESWSLLLICAICMSVCR